MGPHQHHDQYDYDLNQLWFSLVRDPLCTLVRDPLCTLHTDASPSLPRLFLPSCISSSPMMREAIMNNPTQC